MDIDPAKVGKDAGELFGYPKCGVTVTDDIDAALALEADIVMAYTALTIEDGRMMPFTPTAKTLCKVLNAGKNLVTTMPLYFSQAYEPETYAILDSCAKKNSVTYTPSGLLPGAYASYIPMVCSSIMARVDSIIVESGEDDRTNTAAWLRVFSYGKGPSEINKEALEKLIVHYYSCAVYENASILGFAIDELRTSHEVFTAPVDLETVNGPVKKGTISGHRFVMEGMVNGSPKVTMRYVHKVCNQIAPEPPIRDNIHIEGLPACIDVEITGMMPNDEPFATSAAPTVNIIPAVVEAAPGYKQPMELRVVVPLH